MNKKEENDIKSNRERSVAYPSTNLETAIELISKLRSELGKGPYSREDAAKGLGYSGISGASARSVAALVQYGLLIRNGNTYSISELAEEITHPTDETGEKRRQSIVIAAKSPKLFQKIIDRFKNQSLPGLLENILVREGVSSNYSKEVSNLLKDTLQFSGILQNGVITDQINITLSETNNEEKNEIKSSSNNFDSFNFAGLRDIKKTFYNFTDSGDGWSMSIKSERPLSSETKKLLIDISELLENNK